MTWRVRLFFTRSSSPALHGRIITTLFACLGMSLSLSFLTVPSLAMVLCLGRFTTFSAWLFTLTFLCASSRADPCGTSHRCRVRSILSLRLRIGFILNLAFWFLICFCFACFLILLITRHAWRTDLIVKWWQIACMNRWYFRDVWLYVRMFIGWRSVTSIVMVSLHGF